MMELKAQELAGYSVSSNIMLQDAGFGLEKFLFTLFGKAVAWYEEYAFLEGSGVGKRQEKGLETPGKGGLEKGLEKAQDPNRPNRGDWMTVAGRATSRLFLKRRDDVVAFELDGAVREVEGEVVVAELVPKRAAEGVLLVATAHGKGVPLCAKMPESTGVTSDVLHVGGNGCICQSRGSFYSAAQRRDRRHAADHRASSGRRCVPEMPAGGTRLVARHRVD